MRKNIWLLNHHAAGMYFNKGGRTYWLAKYLKEQGYNPVVFCGNSEHGKNRRYIDSSALYVERTVEETGVPYIFVKARVYSGNGAKRVMSWVDYFFNVKKTVRLCEEKYGRPDVIYASSVHPLALVAGIQLARHYGVPCISEVRDLWPESIVAYSSRFKRDDPLMKLLYRGEKWIYQNSDAVVMTWAGGYDYIRDQGWEKDIPESKVVHISNGLDLVPYRQLAEAGRVDDSDFHSGKKTFVYTGSVRKVNNLSLLVDAAKLLARRGNQQAMLLIYGDGNEKEALEQRVATEKLENIRFKGRVPKQEIPAILAQADFTVLHNTSTILDKYGQSQNKFFEYLAAGKPILMTYSVGHSVVRQEQCGVELECQSAEAVADAIEEMCAMDSKTYEHYCENARRCAEQFDFKVLTQRVIELVESLD